MRVRVLSAPGLLGHLRQRAFKEKLNSDVDTASAFMRRPLPYLAVQPKPSSAVLSGSIFRGISWDHPARTGRAPRFAAPETWLSVSVRLVGALHLSGRSLHGPTELKTLVDLILGSAQPMFVVWGQDHIWLYNDAFMPESRGGNG